MNLIQCPNSRHKIVGIGKYLIPLTGDLLRRGTTPAPTRRTRIQELATARPESVTITNVEHPKRLPPFDFVRIHDGAASVETLPANQSTGYVAAIRGGISYGRHCSVMTATGEAVIESGHFKTINDVPVRRWSWAHISGRDARRRWESDLTSRRRLPRIQRVEGRVATINLRYGHNYYHWLVEVLPRIATLRQTGYAPDYYLVDCFKDSQRRTLAMLGIGEHQLIQPHAALTLQASELLLPCFPSPGCLHAFREMFAAAAASEPATRQLRAPRRLFISRRNAKTRRLKNDAEVESLLREREFETHFMEDYSLAQQARLIHGADIVAAVHGAGLANLIFARAGARVVEMVHADRYNRLLFPQLSQTFGLHHWQVIAPSARHKQILSPSLSDLALAIDQAERGLAAGLAA